MTQHLLLAQARRGPCRAFSALIAIVVAGGCSAIDPSVGALRSNDAGADAGKPVSFARDIRPLMNRAADDPTGHGCRACHYSTEASHHGLDVAKLDLATLGALRKGGVTSALTIVVPGDPDRSAIVQKLEGTYFLSTRMPRNGPPYWSQSDIELVRRWIAQGAIGADDE